MESKAAVTERHEASQWVAARDGLTPGASRAWIVCRERHDAFNGCEVFEVARGGPAARFDTQDEAAEVAQFLNREPGR